MLITFELVPSSAGKERLVSLRQQADCIPRDKGMGSPSGSRQSDRMTDRILKREESWGIDLARSPRGSSADSGRWNRRISEQGAQPAPDRAFVRRDTSLSDD